MISYLPSLQSSSVDYFNKSLIYDDNFNDFTSSTLNNSKNNN